MGQQKNTVIINGKVYDAATGKLIKDASKTDQMIADVDKTPATHTKSQPVHNLAHHKPQKSVTLKRTGVHHTPQSAVVKSMPMISSEAVTASVEKQLLSNGNRYERAKSTTKSQAISRFSYSHNDVPKQHLPIDVKPAPAEKAAHHQPLPKADFSSSRDIFSQAISNAQSHEQAPVKLPRRHRVAKKLGVSAGAVNVVAIILVAVTIGGLVVYQNATSIAMHMASNRSGLASASLPSYRPSGFTLNRNIEADPGRVVMNFKSNSDSRAFSVTQSSSNWSSQTLADSFLANKQIQRVDQPNGQIVYLYDSSNATWVDGGIWYKVEGSSSLSSDQLLKLAASF